MRLRTILLSLLALVVLLLGAAFTVLLTTDYSKYRSTIERKVTEATGRAFKIGSDFHVQIGLSPMLVANDVELANAPWGSRPNMIAVKQFEVQINLLPLVLGRISVAHLKLIDADILLETDKSGRGNWVFDTATTPAARSAPAAPTAAKPASGGEIELPDIHDVNIEGVLLQFHDGQTNELRRFSLGHLNLSSAGRDAPLAIDINGTYNDFYAEIGGTVGSPAALARHGAPLPVDITAKLGATDTVLRVQGVFKEPLEAKGYDLRVTATTNELAQIADFARDARFARFQLPKLGPLKAEFTVVDAGAANAATGGVPSLSAVSIDAGRPDLLRLQVTGAVHEAIALKGIALDVVASGQEIGALSGVVLPGVPNGLPQFPPLGPYKLDVKIADGPDRISLPAMRLDLGRDDQLKLAVQGAIRDPLAGRGYALTLDGRAQDLAAVAREFKLDVPLAGPLTVSVKVSDTGPDRYALSGFAVNAAGSDIGGTGSLSLAGARPVASADLASTMIDLSQLLPRRRPPGTHPPPPAAAPKPAGDGRVFPNDPLPFDLLESFDGDLHYRAATIRTPDGPEFHDTTVQAGLHDGVLSVQPISTMIGGGQIAGGASLDGRTGAALVKLTARNVSLHEIDREVPGQALVDGGVTNAVIDVGGTGKTVRALAGNLDGTIFLGIGPGRFKSRYSDMLGLTGLTNLVSKSLPRVEQTTLHCFVTRFDINGGLAKSRVLLADTGRMTLDGSGTINLKTEHLDLGLDTHTKVTNLLSLMPPVSIGGTLADPDFEPDVGAAAFGLVGNVIDDILRQPGNLLNSIIGDDQPPGDQKICAAAYAKAGQPFPGGPRAGAAAPKPDGAGTSSTPEKAIQGLGNSLQRGIRGLGGLLGQ